MRDGTEGAPKDTAHFDPRTGTITVGVQQGGAGAGRVWLTAAPDALTVSTRVTGALAADAAVAKGAMGETAWIICHWVNFVHL